MYQCYRYGKSNLLTDALIFPATSAILYIPASRGTNWMVFFDKLPFRSSKTPFFRQEGHSFTKCPVIYAYQEACVVLQDIFDIATLLKSWYTLNVSKIIWYTNLLAKQYNVEISCVLKKIGEAELFFQIGLGWGLNLGQKYMDQRGTGCDILPTWPKARIKPGTIGWPSDVAKDKTFFQLGRELKLNPGPEVDWVHYQRLVEQWGDGWIILSTLPGVGSKPGTRCWPCNTANIKHWLGVVIEPRTRY